MKLLIKTANTPEVKTLIEKFYSYPTVEGFALGVHGKYKSLFRGEYVANMPGYDILNDSFIQDQWAIFCQSRNFPANYSPIYIVIYVNQPEIDFKNQNKDLLDAIKASMRQYDISIETIEPVLGTAFKRNKRPIEGGISISLNRSSEKDGTLGGLLKERKTGDIYLLTCNHVLNGSNSNDVIQRSALYGGKAPSDKVAVFSPQHHAVPYLNDGFSFSSQFNDVDAAIARVVNGGCVSKCSVRQLGLIVSSLSKFQLGLDDEVVFVGKESDRQEAVINRYIARLKVRIDNMLYNFGDIFEIEPREPKYISHLCNFGDSGSWVVRENNGLINELCGMLFAKSGRKKAYCCFIDNVLDKLQNKFEIF